jgi:hypothetical protein
MTEPTLSPNTDPAQAKIKGAGRGISPRRANTNAKINMFRPAPARQRENKPTPGQQASRSLKSCQLYRLKILVGGDGL